MFRAAHPRVAHKNNGKPMAFGHTYDFVLHRTGVGIDQDSNVCL
jgi:hypothetical protein